MTTSTASGADTILGPLGTLLPDLRAIVDPELLRYRPPARSPQAVDSSARHLGLWCVGGRRNPAGVGTPDEPKERS